MHIVLDIGTSGVKALIFDETNNVISKSYATLERSFPHTGWVEQNPPELIEKSVHVLQEAYKAIYASNNHISLGITTQRETIVVWNPKDGSPYYPAIVWQDERTKELCNAMQPQAENLIQSRTGLSMLPYFSASKLTWILDTVPGLREKALAGDVRAGTVDTWVLWNLTRERNFLTDQTNASRTLLYNIHTLSWDPDLLELFQIPHTILPSVQESVSRFGVLDSSILGVEIPIEAVVGDQQSSLFAAGENLETTKITYGSGVFIMQVVPEDTSVPDGFFKTLTASTDNRYALEAKVCRLAEYVTPLLDKHKELEILLAGTCNQVAPYIERLPFTPKEIVVDGGVTQNDFMLDEQARILGIPLRRQKIFDGTALGVAKLLASTDSLK